MHMAIVRCLNLYGILHMPYISYLLPGRKRTGMVLAWHSAACLNHPDTFDTYAIMNSGSNNKELEHYDIPLIPIGHPIL